jgi:DNA-binding NarL/FixJ family response regulator
LAAGVLGAPRERCYAIAEHCLSIATASGALWAKSWAELSWALALIKHGSPNEALVTLRRTLSHQLRIRDQWGATWAVEFRVWALAAVLTDLGSGTVNSRERARTAEDLATEIAHLTGGVKALRRDLGISIEAMGTFADESAKACAVARKTLGSEIYAAAEKRGGQLRPERQEVQLLALGALSLGHSSGWGKLTQSEQDVAVLAAAGWTNAQIAHRRGTSPRTVGAQMSTILDRLNITSREEIIAHIPADLIDKVSAAAAGGVPDPGAS